MGKLLVGRARPSRERQPPAPCPEGACRSAARRMRQGRMMTQKTCSGALGSATPFAKSFSRGRLMQ